MRKWMIVLALMATAFAARAENGTISGRVIDASTGAPVTDVEVVAVERDGTAAVAAPAADGTYTLAVPPGVYSVRTRNVLAPNGYVMQLYNGIDLPAPDGELGTAVVVASGKTSGGIDFHLRPIRGVVRGRITDQNGAPVAGAEITVERLRSDVGPQPPVPALRSGADGSYAFIIGPGIYTVTVTAPGHVRAVSGGEICPTCSGKPFQVAERQELVLDFVLPELSRFRGTVLRIDGVPLAGVALLLRGVKFTASGATDANGAFDISAYPDVYAVSVRRTASLPVTLTFTLDLSTARTVERELRLGSGGRMEGHVLDGVTFQPVAGVKLSTRADSTVSAADGAFVLYSYSDANATDLTVSVPDGYVAVPLRLDLAARATAVYDQPAFRDIYIVRGGTISGRVIDRATQQPVPSATVSVYARSALKPSTTVTTAADGTFRSEPQVLGDDYTLLVAPPKALGEPQAYGAGGCVLGCNASPSAKGRRIRGKPAADTPIGDVSIVLGTGHIRLLSMDCHGTVLERPPSASTDVFDEVGDPAGYIQSGVALLDATPGTYFFGAVYPDHWLGPRDLLSGVTDVVRQAKPFTVEAGKTTTVVLDGCNVRLAVKKIAPQAGPTAGQNLVTISFEGDTTPQRVTFGGVPAPIVGREGTYYYNRTLTVVAPRHAEGAVPVVVDDGTTPIELATPYHYTDDCTPVTIAPQVMVFPTVPLHLDVRGSLPITYEWFRGVPHSRTEPLGNGDTLTADPGPHPSSFWVSVRNDCSEIVQTFYVRRPKQRAAGD